MVVVVHHHPTKECLQGKWNAPQLFDISEIADHANNCADIWVGKIEQVESFLQDQEDESEMEVL